MRSCRGEIKGPVAQAGKGERSLLRGIQRREDQALQRGDGRAKRQTCLLATGGAGMVNRIPALRAGGTLAAKAKVADGQKGALQQGGRAAHNRLLTRRGN